ncbi:MAG: phosphate regulon sensor histidine kinase PhoR [Gammaproteobacteria bacterium]|nr:phosphate regulon sensor histidine kinase PhoR [Gammaproteobacteria bacterium]
MPPVWTSALLRLAGLIIAGAIVGWFYDHMLLGVLLVAIGSLGWHLYHLYRLDEWLRTGRLRGVTDGSGVWPPVFARIEYIREKSRRRRRRWRDVLRELQASAGAFPDGGVLLDGKHGIVTFNAAAARLLSLKKGRDRGQRIDNLLRHPDFVAYVAEGDFSRTIEVPAPAGGDTWISCLMIPYGPEQRLLLVRDITATLRVERMRRDFVANSSHELRTPLTVISGYLDALAGDERAPADWHAPLAEMRSQSTRMAQLLDDLLELSRLESAAPCGLEREVDMAALLQAARREALAMPERPRRVEVESASATGVLGDSRELHSVVSNLVSNAIRYTPPEGAVRISWQVDRAGGHLAVADTGIGIAEEDIPRITERFYRTDHGRARQQGGTGLGLAIVKHCLRRHEAELEIRSRPGEGSTFTCHFPPHRLAPS